MNKEKELNDKEVFKKIHSNLEWTIENECLKISISPKLDFEFMIANNSNIYRYIEDIKAEHKDICLDLSQVPNIEKGALVTYFLAASGKAKKENSKIILSGITKCHEKFLKRTLSGDFNFEVSSYKDIEHGTVAECYPLEKKIENHKSVEINENKESNIKRFLEIGVSSVVLSIISGLGGYFIGRNVAIKGNTKEYSKEIIIPNYKKEIKEPKNETKPQEMELEKEGFVSQYNYRINSKDRCLEVYLKDANDPKIPDFKLDFPREYMKVKGAIASVQNRLERAANLKAKQDIVKSHYRTLEFVKDNFFEVLPSDSAFNRLGNPKEKEAAAKAVEDYVISFLERTDKILKKNPVEIPNSTYHNSEDIF